VLPIGAITLNFFKTPIFSGAAGFSKVPVAHRAGSPSLIILTIGFGVRPSTADTLEPPRAPPRHRAAARHGGRPAAVLTLLLLARSRRTHRSSSSSSECRGLPYGEGSWEEFAPPCMLQKKSPIGISIQNIESGFFFLNEEIPTG
jgi:hypothetical protein